MSLLHRDPRTLLPFLLLATACTGAGDGGEEPADPAPRIADLVLTGGRVVTVDDDVPEGRALAVLGKRVLAVGDEEEIAAHIGPGTEVIDLGGKLAIPGFIEGHAHFLGIGDARLQLRLMDVRNWGEIVAMVEAAVAEAAPGELIRGRGWHQEKWDTPIEDGVDGLPRHDSLSAVSPDHPVVLRHASGHATFANARAMEMAGITADTPDPEGGEIVRDADGAPIGVFRETASSLLSPVFRDATPPDPRRMAELADEEVVSKGITSFQDAGSSFDDIALFREMAEAGELDVRLWVMIRATPRRLAEALPTARIVGLADDHLTVHAIKLSLDGALGSHGAWLLEPYTDLPESTGLNTTPMETFIETARLAAVHDFQLCVHAIGDRANREVLDVFEATFAEHGRGAERRWRVEHAQHLNPAEVPRFAGLGVIASMQGVHCTSDGPWVPDRLGDHRSEEGAYVWRKLLEAGAVVSNGTDAPVEDVDPIASYYSTVTRRMANGEVFYGGQRMTRMEALRSYTIACAIAAFEEDRKGSLTPGKLADVTVLTKDILSIPEDEIPTAEVAMTIVGGEVVYSRPE